MCLDSMIEDSYPQWTPYAVNLANSIARTYTINIPSVMALSTLLVLALDIYIHRKKTSWRLAGFCLILAYYVSFLMEIAVHYGIKIGGRVLVPRVLPNRCEEAWIVEYDHNGASWPCASDALMYALKTGVLVRGSYLPSALSMGSLRVGFMLVVVPVGFGVWGALSLYGRWCTGSVTRGMKLEENADEKPKAATS